MVGHNKFILAALETVREAGFDPRLKAHVGAVITRGGSIISASANTYGPNSYSLRRTTNEFLCSTHAEVNAIMQVRRKVDLTGLKMWVARLTKPLTLTHPMRTGLDPYIANAEPCRECKQVISRYGIRRVCFTIDNETTGLWRVPRVNVPRKHYP